MRSFAPVTIVSRRGGKVHCGFITVISNVFQLPEIASMGPLCSRSAPGKDCREWHTWTFSPTTPNLQRSPSRSSGSAIRQPVPVSRNQAGAVFLTYLIFVRDHRRETRIIRGPSRMRGLGAKNRRLFRY